MKKILTFASIALFGLGLASCDDFLDKSRYPITSMPNTPEYWNNASNVEAQCNYLYETYTGYGNAGGTGWFYFQTLSDDQAGNSFTTWHTAGAVPANNSTYNNGFIEIRRCNYIINNVRTSTLSPDEKLNFEGIARLNRARQYYLLVRMFGDMVWTNSVIDPDTPVGQEELNAQRTDRHIVMDSVLNDLNYAIAAIGAKSGKQVWSKDLALALKSEVCLYEGTFCKYRTKADNNLEPDPVRAKKFLEESAKASEALIGDYPVSDDYAAIYNSTGAALSANKEVIFMKRYEKDLFMHSTIDYTCSSTMVSGITRDAFDSFLFVDGKPLALTAENTDDAGVSTTEQIGDSIAYRLDISAQLAVRDKRLTALTDPYVYYPKFTWPRWGAMEMTSSTGYGIRKYDSPSFPVANRDQTGSNYSACPLYWISYIYCNFAEAKAELGTLSDTDLNNSINKLYTRAGLPTQTVASLSNMNDPANNMNVSSLLWEIRRCRRCELMTDNWIRYWDLVRWHQLDKLDNTKYPKIAQGANTKNAKIQPPTKDGDYYGAYFSKTRTYAPKYYLYPIPTSQLALNPNYKQNYLW